MVRTYFPAIVIIALLDTICYGYNCADYFDTTLCNAIPFYTCTNGRSENDANCPDPCAGNQSPGHLYGLIPIPPTSDGFNDDKLSSDGQYWNKCPGLNAIIIPSTATSLGFVFAENVNLQNVHIPTSIVSIGDYTFALNPALNSIEIPTSVVTIGTAAFEESGLTSIVIPTSVTYIGVGAFDRCLQLASISLPTSLSQLSDSTFRGTKLTSITLPTSITYLSQRVFENCYFLTSATLPNVVSVESGLGVFNHDSALTCISAPPATLAAVVSSSTQLDSYSSTSCGKATAPYLKVFVSTATLTYLTIPNYDKDGCPLSGESDILYLRVSLSVTNTGTAIFVPPTSFIQSVDCGTVSALVDFYNLTFPGGPYYKYAKYVAEADEGFDDFILPVGASFSAVVNFRVDPVAVNSYANPTYPVSVSVSGDLAAGEAGTQSISMIKN